MKMMRNISRMIMKVSWSHYLRPRRAGQLFPHKQFTRTKERELDFYAQNISPIAWLTSNWPQILTSWPYLSGKSSTMSVNCPKTFPRIQSVISHEYSLLTSRAQKEKKRKQIYSLSRREKKAPDGHLLQNRIILSCQPWFIVEIDKKEIFVNKTSRMHSLYAELECSVGVLNLWGC